MPRLLAPLAVLLLLAGATLLVGRHVGQREVGRFGAVDDAVAVGVFHVHSDQSHDSDLSGEQIIGAAKSQGLDFVVLTDHNAQAAAPMVRDGIVVLSSSELSTPFGHLIQLGASRLLDKSELGELDVLARVRELGGFPIAAHPSDAKRPWEGPAAGLAGFEVANVSAAARRYGGPALVGLVPIFAGFPANHVLALAQLYDRDTEALARWDTESSPSVVGLCGVDAHGWIDPALNLRFWQIVLFAPLPSTPSERAAFVLRELSAGRFFCSAGLLGGPPPFRFVAIDNGQVSAMAGASLPRARAQMLTASAPGLLGKGTSLVLFRNGQAILRQQGEELRYDRPSPGTYRIEVWTQVPGLLYGERIVPVAYSNRIRVIPDEPGSLEPSP